MPTKISGQVPLGVDIAYCQRELKRDRRELRETRALFEEERIREAMKLEDAAFVVKSVGVAVEVFGRPAAELEGAVKKDRVAEPNRQQAESLEGRSKGVAGELQKCIEEGAGRLRRDAARLRSAEMGEDFASKSSSKMAAQLSKLRRPRG